MALRTLAAEKTSPCFSGKTVFERFHLERQGFVRVGADDFYRAHLVAFVFFDGNGDVDGFAL